MHFIFVQVVSNLLGNFKFNIFQDKDCKLPSTSHSQLKKKAKKINLFSYKILFILLNVILLKLLKKQ